MSIFCFDCIENSSGASFISLIPASVAVCISLFALFIARRNLKSVFNSHALQAQMNIISLEKELRDSRKYFKLESFKLATAITNTSQNLQKIPQNDQVYIDYQTAFEKYMFCADKLALLIYDGLLNVPFPKRDWKSQYKHTFDEVEQTFSANLIKISQFENIENLKKLLVKWNKKD